MVEYRTFNPFAHSSNLCTPTKSAILALFLAFSGCAAHQSATLGKCKELIILEDILSYEIDKYSRLCEMLRLTRHVIKKKKWIEQIDESLKKCDYVFGKE